MPRKTPGALRTLLTIDVVARGELREKDELVEHRGFGGSENTLYDTVVVDTSRHVLVQTHRTYTKSEP